MSLLEGRATLHRLPVLRVSQHPISVLRSYEQDDVQGRRGGGARKSAQSGGLSAAVPRVIPSLTEADWKTKIKSKATTKNPVEKLNKTVVG